MILIFFVFMSALAFSCDNTLLLLLTGDSQEDSILRKLSHVSGEMQKTAEFVQGFNHAAALSVHMEVLNKWVYIVTLITSSPSTYSASDVYMPIVTKISQELGRIRRLLNDRKLEHVHGLLELSVARLSLLSALIVNGPDNIRHFIELEILIFGSRPGVSSDIDICIERFNSLLKILDLPEKEEVTNKFNDVRVKLKSFLKTDINDNAVKTMLAYQNLYNSFVSAKQLLLSTGYFTDDI